jgi:hypothetical protein
MNKIFGEDQEIENKLLSKENKSKDIKVMKTSQKGDELKKNREYTNRRWF